MTTTTVPVIVEEPSTTTSLVPISKIAVSEDSESVQIIGNEDEDSIGCEIFTLMHTDNCEQAVEIFCHEKDIYNI